MLLNADAELTIPYIDPSPALIEPGPVDYPFIMPDASTEFDLTDGHDRIITTKLNQIKYFSDGTSATLKGSDVYTSSISSSNHPYYYGVMDGDPGSSKYDTQFYVGWGHYAGSGSNTDSDTIKGSSEAIYKQYAEMLLDNPEGGFYITSGSNVWPRFERLTKDESIYILNFKQDRFKDQLQERNWTLTLSGSHEGGSNTIHLTDNSSQKPGGTSTKVGRRYDIISGSFGNIHGSTLFKRYGFFYPDVGIMVFGDYLRWKIYGPSVTTHTYTASFNTPGNYNYGLNPGGAATNNGDYKNALRFINCLRNVNGNCFTLYGEKETTDVTYICKIKTDEFNFTNNPSILSSSGNSMGKSEPGRMNGFLSGSDNVSTMDGNPHTFITQVHMHNEYGIPVAVAHLSKPLMKNFTQEAYIKVKLSY